MSTRAVYSFVDSDGTFHVYKHSDGYPSGAFDAIDSAVAQAWTLPRFEADEFAAAFVAANKSYWRNTLFEELNKEKPEADKVKLCKEYMVHDGGGVRLMQCGPVKTVAPSDIQYRYEVSRKDGKLHIKAYSTNYWKEKRTERRLFAGTLEAFKAYVATLEG